LCWLRDAESQLGSGALAFAGRRVSEPSAIRDARAIHACARARRWRGRTFPHRATGAARPAAARAAGTRSARPGSRPTWHDEDAALSWLSVHLTPITPRRLGAPGRGNHVPYSRPTVHPVEYVKTTVPPRSVRRRENGPAPHAGTRAHFFALRRTGTPIIR